LNGAQLLVHVFKLVASGATSCNASTVGSAANPLALGLAAWGTALDAALVDLIPRMQNRQLPRLRVVMLANNEIVMKEMARRGCSASAGTIGAKGFGGIVKLRQISTISRRARPTPRPRINKLAVLLGDETANKFPKLTIPVSIPS
jgi:hypothetical protein